MGVSPLPKRKSIAGAMLFLRRTENALACKISSFLNLYFIHSFVGSMECHVVQVLPGQRFVDFVYAVPRYTSFRPQMYIFPFTDLHLPVVQCSVIALPLPFGSSTAAVRQRYHRPVVERTPPSERRESPHRETGRPRFQLDNDEVCDTSFTTYAYPHSQRKNSVYAENLICVLQRRPNLRTVKAK